MQGKKETENIEHFPFSEMVMFLKSKLNEMLKRDLFSALRESMTLSSEAYV